MKKLLLVLMIAVFALAQNYAQADIVLVTAKGWNNHLKQNGVYHFCVDELGNEYTVFIGNNGGIGQKKGHVTWLIEEGEGNNGNEEPAPDSPIPVELEAQTMLYQQLDNEIVVKTDKPVKLKIVDMQSGNFIGEEINAMNDIVITIADLPSGCKYGVAVFQNFEDYGYYGDRLIDLHTFCKINQ